MVGGCRGLLTDWDEGFDALFSTNTLIFEYSE